MNRTPDISDQSIGLKHSRGLLFLQVILLLLLTSCEKTIDWPLDTNEPKVIVVEGVITNERKAHEVRISRPMADINSTPLPVSGAIVTILEGVNASNDRAIRLREDQPGRYLTDSTVRAVSGLRYTLKIFYQGQEYSGDSRMVQVDPLKPLSYSKIPDHEFWYEMNLKETNKPSMVEYRLNWGHLPGFRNLPVEETRAHIIYYTVKSVDVNKIFKPAKERVPFPVGTRVYRRQYSMNQEQENFVRSLMAETEWRGGLFDLQPGNVRTNLSEGAVGYFSVSQVVADTSVILPLN
jgi:hypothetical protein